MTYFLHYTAEIRSHEAIRLLVPPGKHLPPLGGLALSGEPSSNSRRSENLQTSSVSALMLCCCSMITSSYPVQVLFDFEAMPKSFQWESSDCLVTVCFYICFHSMIYVLSIFCNIYLIDSVSQYEIVQQYDVFIDNRSLYLFALC